MEQSEQTTDGDEFLSESLPQSRDPHCQPTSWLSSCLWPSSRSIIASVTRLNRRSWLSAGGSCSTAAAITGCMNLTRNRCPNGRICWLDKRYSTCWHGRTALCVHDRDHTFCPQGHWRCGLCGLQRLTVIQQNIPARCPRRASGVLTSLPLTNLWAATCSGKTA